MAERMPGAFRMTLVELGLGVALLGACVILTAYDFVLGPIAALLAGGSRFLIYWVWWQTRKTWHLTVELGAEATRRFHLDGEWRAQLSEVPLLAGRTESLRRHEFDSGSADIRIVA